MGKLTSTGFDVLTSMVEEHGEANIVEEVAGRVAEGETLKDIVRSYGIPYSVLWRWLKDKPERMAAYRDGLEARAEAEAIETLTIADDAKPEDVAVARLRVDTRKFLAGKWSPGTYGDGKVGGGSGITVVVERGVRAEVVGGVLRIGSEDNKGYQRVDTAAVIEGETV